MAMTTLVSPEKYLRTAYDPDMEYVDGHLVERNVGEFYHSVLQSLIICVLMARRVEHRFSVFTAQRVRVSDEPRYRIPDVCIKALPFQVTPVIEKPDLVIEIVSPDDSPGELVEKVGDYQAAGIPHIWIVDPYKRKVTVIDIHGTRNAANLIAETELAGSVDFAPLFAELDRAGQEY